MFDVVGIGVPFVDFLVNVDEIPLPNETKKLHDYSWQGGGKVPTALVTLSRLGRKTGAVVAVGDDAFGRFTLEDFCRHGVDTTQAVTQPGRQSPFSVIVSDRKTVGRAIMYNTGTVEPLDPKAINWDYVLRCRVLHLSGSTPCDVEAAMRAKRRGIPVVVDADLFDELLLEMAPFVDYFAASEDFAQGYGGVSLEQMAAEIAALVPRAVVVTLGAAGCYYYSSQCSGTAPGFAVDAIDTLGAGDVYHGAFIHGVLEQWPLDRTCRFANAVSAMKCTQIGGRAGIPTLGETEKFLTDQVVDLADAPQFLRQYRNLPGSS